MAVVAVASASIIIGGYSQIIISARYKVYGLSRFLIFILGFNVLRTRVPALSACGEDCRALRANRQPLR